MAHQLLDLSKLPALTPPPGTRPSRRREDEKDQEPSLCRQPWVQNILPFATSLSVHAGILVIGIAITLGAGTIAQNAPMCEQEIVPAADVREMGGGLANLDTFNDPTRPAVRDQDQNEPAYRINWTLNAGPRNPLIDIGSGTGDTEFGPEFVGGAGSRIGSALNGAPGGNDEGGRQYFGIPPGGSQGPKGSLFGNCGNARRIAFVFDSSGSMINKMPTLKDQLTQTILKLRPSQAFDVIFFRGQDCDSFSKQTHKGGLVPATPAAKQACAGPNGFLEGIVSGGISDPIPSIEQAFKDHPQLIYILTDGDFPDNDAVLKRIDELRKIDPKVKINTIAFTGDGDNDTAFLPLLKKIAEQSGGVFRHVKESDLEESGK